MPAGRTGSLPSSPPPSARLAPAKRGRGGPEEGGRDGRGAAGAEPEAEMAGRPRSPPRVGRGAGAGVEEPLREELSCCGDTGSGEPARRERNTPARFSPLWAVPQA